MKSELHYLVDNSPSLMNIVGKLSRLSAWPADYVF